MQCYQAGCSERPTWQLTLTYRPSAPGAEPVAFGNATCSCWKHRAQMIRSFSGARAAVRIQASLRRWGVDPAMAGQTKATVMPIFG